MQVVVDGYLRQMRARFEQLRPFLFHLTLWLLFATYEQVTLFISSGFHFGFFIICLNYLLNAGLFYSNSRVLLPRLGTRHHYAGYVLVGLLALGSYAVLRTELTLHLVPYIETLPDEVKTSYWRFWLLSVYRGAFFLFVSLGYWFARNAIALEQARRVQEHQLRLTEKSLLEANLAFLRSQINPHFLFNSLNFLYAQVYPHSEPAAEGILLLADTMRYALHENGDGKVPLVQEVQHLHNYIALNQLRFNQQLQVDFQVVGTPQFILIPPLVLITFVENCFKHGELADAAYPLRMRLVVAGGQLTFETHNRKRHGPKEPHSGIGLANTRARLALAYPERHTLTITDAPDFYTCHLALEL